jgi:alpha-D-ribose 1-methylphosphonate 5-triphosphate synthase subunit PhnH
MTELSQALDSVQSAQAFRSILQAMSKPGHAVNLAADPTAKSGLLPTTSVLIQTLCDFQTPIWLHHELAQDSTIRSIKFHTGAPLTSNPAEAAFAVLSATQKLPPLSAFAQGTHEYPDRSTTLIIEVEGFTPQGVALTGPGLKDVSHFGVQGLDVDFWQQLIANNRQYPLGVDVIFASPTQIACCPRSTTIMLKEIA